jgi:hypothetical protein
MCEQEQPTLTAIQVSEDTFGFSIIPASAGRDWMSATRHGFARRCLRLLIANQSGWEVLNPVEFTANWDGTTELAGVRLSGHFEPEIPARSHFGHGILTWTIPYLFRTSPGFNLLVRGPANSPKDGIAPLEGIVETDCCPATFTINWMFTRPGSVHFKHGEPIAMLVPCRRGELEQFDVSASGLDDATPVPEDYRKWRSAREAFLGDLATADTVSKRDRWQGDYFRGALGSPPADAGKHQTRLHLKSFERNSTP